MVKLFYHPTQSYLPIFFYARTKEPKLICQDVDFNLLHSFYHRCFFLLELDATIPDVEDKTIAFCIVQVAKTFTISRRFYSNFYWKSRVFSLDDKNAMIGPLTI